SLGMPSKHTQPHIQPDNMRHLGIAIAAALLLHSIWFERDPAGLFDSQQPMLADNIKVKIPGYMTDSTFWNDVEQVSAEIENACTIFHTWEELNRLALEDTAVLATLNENALFWLTQRHCLQSSLFMTLSRI